MQQQHHHHYYQPNTPLSNMTPHLVFDNTNNNPYLRKRKFAELNNFDNNSNISKSRFSPYVAANSINVNPYNNYQNKPVSYFTSKNFSTNSNSNSGESLHTASNLIPSSSSDSDSLTIGMFNF
jgi:hypothetical protein